MSVASGASCGNASFKIYPTELKIVRVARNLVPETVGSRQAYLPLCNSVFPYFFCKAATSRSADQRSLGPRCRRETALPRSAGAEDGARGPRAQRRRPVLGLGLGALDGGGITGLATARVGAARRAPMPRRSPPPACARSQRTGHSRPTPATPGRPRSRQPMRRSEAGSDPRDRGVRAA